MTRESLVSAIRQPTSAALAGLVFGAILSVALVLLHSAEPAVGAEATAWSADPAKRDAVNLAVSLVPFAGIAFMWFIAVIRSQLGSSEDRFFETVFLGSGLIFVALLFTASAALKGVLIVGEAGAPASPEMRAYAWGLAAALLGTFGSRMVAVFMLSATTMGMRTRTIPRWLGIPAYVIALLLLLTPPLPDFVQFLFPAWVIVLSLFILARRHLARPPRGSG